jgi:hypothetical protein
LKDNTDVDKATNDFTATPVATAPVLSVLPNEVVDGTPILRPAKVKTKLTREYNTLNSKEVIKHTAKQIKDAQRKQKRLEKITKKLERKGHI